MPSFQRNLKEVLEGEKKIVQTIHNVNLQCIPVKFSARVAQEINYLLRIFEGNKSSIAERRLKLELAATLTGTILSLQWKCVEQTYQTSVFYYLHVDLCRQIVQRKKKRLALLGKRDGFFKKQADRKIISEYNQTFKDNPIVENRLLDGEDDISVLRALGRPSTGLPIEDADLTRFGNLAPLMSTSLVPVVREYIDSTNNLSIGLPTTSGVAARYTIGEPSAILGVQAPGDLVSYIEDINLLPAEKSAPVLKVTHNLRKVKEEAVNDEPVAANLTSVIQPVEQNAPVIENESATIENPVPVENVTSFVDVTIDEMRVLHAQRSGQRALLADLYEINQTNRDQTVIPETPDSDIHQLLEPVMPNRDLRKKRKLVIDEQTRIIDYSARAVRLGNQSRPIQNLFEKTNFNLKRLKITMSTGRLFKLPACSSLFNPMRASVLTKAYERHLITDDMPTESISSGVPVEGNLFINPNVPRQDNDGTMVKNGDISNLSLPNRNSVVSRNSAAEGMQIPQEMTLQPETMRQPSNIIIADESILPDNAQPSVPQENNPEKEAVGDVTINRREVIENPEIRKDSTDNVHLVSNVPQSESSAANVKKTSILDQFLNMVSLDRNNLIEVQELPVPPVQRLVNIQQETSVNGAQSIIDPSLSLPNRADMTNIIQELMVPVGNVVLNEVEKNLETDIVNMSMNQGTLIEKEPTLPFDNALSRNLLSTAQNLPASFHSEIIQQPPCFAESNGHVTDNIRALNGNNEAEGRDVIRVIPIARLQEDTSISRLHRGLASKEKVIPAIQESGFENSVKPIFEPRSDPPRKEYRSEEYVMSILKQNWELVNMISIADILGTEHTLSNEVVLINTLLRWNNKWAVQIIKVYDTLAISPFTENIRDISMSF